MKCRVLKYTWGPLVEWVDELSERGHVDECGPHFSFFCCFLSYILIGSIYYSSLDAKRWQEIESGEKEKRREEREGCRMRYPWAVRPFEVPIIEDGEKKKSRKL